MVSPWVKRRKIVAHKRIAAEKAAAAAAAAAYAASPAGLAHAAAGRRRRPRWGTPPRSIRTWPAEDNLNLKKVSIEDVFKCVGLQENDVILYLGGRIDDDALYPKEYRKYLNSKIKRLKPTKIICHNHWYAKKYFDKGILPKNAKIDLILTYSPYFIENSFTSINREYYDGHPAFLRTLTDESPNIICALYWPARPKEIVPYDTDVNAKSFHAGYDLNNVKYFSFGRAYTPQDLAPPFHDTDENPRNATDGFAILTNLIKAGFKNINILGFSAFGSEEDQSYHTEFGPGEFAGQKYFDLKTSEDQRTESDILQYWVQTKKIKNMEDYNKFISCLKRKK